MGAFCFSLMKKRKICATEISKIGTVALKDGRLGAAPCPVRAGFLTGRKKYNIRIKFAGLACRPV